MKKQCLMINHLYRLLFLSLVLGQFQRILITTNVWIYGHDIIVLLILLSTLILSWQQRRQLLESKLTKVKIKLFFWLVVGFLIWTSLSYCISFLKIGSQALVGGLYLGRLLLYVSLAFSTWLGLKQKWLSINLLDQIYLTCIAVSLIGLVQYLFQPDTRFLLDLGYDEHLNRLLSVYLDPNFTGMVLIIGYWLAQRKHGAFWQSILFLITLGLTYSRISYLAFGVSLLIDALVKRRFKLLLIISIAFAILVMVLPKSPGEGTNLLRTQSVESRLNSQTRALALFIKNPIFGVGFNNYKVVQAEKYGLWSQHTSSPDNSFLFIFVTTGLIGGLLFLSLVILSLFQSLRTTFDGLWQIQLSLIIHSLANNTWFFSSITLIIMLILALIWSQKVKGKTKPLFLDR